jgi:hypothetical protein
MRFFRLVQSGIGHSDNQNGRVGKRKTTAKVADLESTNPAVGRSIKFVKTPVITIQPAVRMSKGLPRQFEERSNLYPIFTIKNQGFSHVIDYESA